MNTDYKFFVQDKKKVRVIIDTDAACEADDQYAIVHALMTPKLIVKGIIAEQFAIAGGEESVKKSYDEIIKLLDLMNITDIPVYSGIALPLDSENASPDSEAVDFIIEEALKEDEKPLYVLCQGAVTNVAAAINKNPAISDKFTCIWIGGGAYPDGGWEFNLTNDHNAANIIFKSGVELWQVPMNCYIKMQVGYAELQTKVMPCGRLGKYLFEEMQELSKKEEWISGESWALGDSPVVGLSMNPVCGQYEIRKAPICDKDGMYTGETEHKIRVYNDIDSRYILEDFFAKLKICFG